MSDVAGRPRSLRLLIILLIGLACMDACMFVMIEERFIKNEAFFIGLMIGQFAFAGVLAGGVGRAWASSFALTSVLAISINTMLIAMSSWPKWNDADDFLDPFLLLNGCTPPLLFCCSLPFLLTRALTGYRLSFRSETTGRTINMEDFFLATGVCAAMLVPAPAAFEAIDESGDGLVGTMTVAGLMVSGVSLVVILPSTMAYFVLKHPAVRLAVLAGICVGAPMILVTLLSLSGLLHLSGTTFVEEFAPPLATAAGCFAMCLVVLRAAGYVWVRNEKRASVVVVNPLDDEDHPQAPDMARRLNRFATAAIVLGSVAFVLFTRGLEQTRRIIDDRTSAIKSEWSIAGGHVQQFRYTTYSFRAPPSARPEDIAFLLKSNTLHSIEAAGTAITDRMLEQTASYADLQTLDLSHTEISDEGLRALKSATNLANINLAHTKVTVSGLQAFLAGQEHLHTVNLSGLRLTDSDIAKLPVSSISRLSLGDNPITAAALPVLRSSSSLNLTRTQIAGADLSQLQASHLVLDHTPITDAQLRARFESQHKLESLSLRGTQVTDASLPLMQNLSYLALGDSPITAAGLAQSAVAAVDPANGNPPTGSYNKLALNDKRFDGSLFAKRKWFVVHLDLRNSGISDRDINQLANVAGLSILDLRGSEVTDASLPFLSTLSLSVIELTGTKVTGQAAWQYLENVAVYISPSQCSEETKQLARGSRWCIGDSLDAPLSE